MRFGLKIGEHDLAIKLKKVEKFLDDGHKVKLTIVYRGREQAHKEMGFKLAEKVISDFGDKVVVDQQPQLAGRQLNFVLRSAPSSSKRIQHNISTQQGANHAETKNS